MGKKTKFINKDNSQKFHLLHRSQTDAAYANEEVPSEFVLVAADESMNATRQRNQRDALSAKLRLTKDHINELGFVNDGYDYSQHLKEMGGGKYIGKNGKEMDMDFSYNKEVQFELPEDALPSGTEMERDLQAITISHDLMDADIHAALFDDADEEGEFEELQDDFITEAMTEPMDNDFDYEAHIAALIARSEEKLGVNKARGWDGAGDKKLRARRVRYEDDEAESGDEEFSDFDEDDEDDEDGYNSEEDRAFRDVLSAEERQKIEMQFERTLDEYGEEEIGELEDDEDQLDGGEIELTSDNPLFVGMIEEFLQDQVDLKYAEGRLVLPKGTRSTLLVRDGQDAQAVVDENGQAIERAEVDIKKERAEQELLQAESAEYLHDLDVKGEKHVEIETCQQYLREEREVEKWDCESILSTYSTLDNHPSMIKDTNAKFRKYRSHHERTLEAEAKATSDTASLGTREAVPRRAMVGTNLPGRIVLAGKMHIPEGFGPGETGVPKKAPKVKTISSSSVKPAVTPVAMTRIAEGDSEGEDEKENEGAEESGDDDDEDRSRSSFEDEFEKKAPAPGSRPRDETADKKRLRKLKVKEDRKTKRVSKKELRSAYQSESNRILRINGREQATDHISVFKYSN